MNRFAAIFVASVLLAICVEANDELIPPEVRSRMGNLQKRLAQRMSYASSSSFASGNGATASSSSSAGYFASHNGQATPVTSQHQSFSGNPNDTNARVASQSVSQAGNQAFAQANAQAVGGQRLGRGRPAARPRAQTQAQTQTFPSSPVYQAPPQPAQQVQDNKSTAQVQTFSQSYVDPGNENSRAEAHGIYADDGQGSQSSSYVSDVEDLQEHEDGNEEDDHYYKASSSAKDHDENHHDNFKHKNHDVYHDGNVYKSSKSSTSYSSNHNKKIREMGSGVLSKDRHRAAFNRDYRKLRENVNQNSYTAGNGFFKPETFSSSVAHEDEDVTGFDSDGLSGMPALPPVPGKSNGKQQRNNQPAARNSGFKSAAASAAIADGAMSTSAAVGPKVATVSSASG